MSDLNPAFANINTFSELLDAHQAHPCKGITGNDLVRAWNIIAKLRLSGCSTTFLRYAEINISQSSVRTIASKLNILFRHIGFFSPSQCVQISNVGFYYAEITVGEIDLTRIAWNTEPAFPRGRGQDRVNTRHLDGHRNSWKDFSPISSSHA